MPRRSASRRSAARASFSLQRLQREDMAPGQPRAQVVAQGQVHRRHAAGRRPRHAVRRRPRRTARRRPAAAAASSGSQPSSTHQRPARLQQPRRRVGGVEPADTLAGAWRASPAPAAGASCRCRTGPTGTPAPPACATHAGAPRAAALAPVQEGVEGGQRVRADRQRDLLHRRVVAAMPRHFRGQPCPPAGSHGSVNARGRGGRRPGRAGARAARAASSASRPVLQVGQRLRRDARPPTP